MIPEVPLSEAEIRDAVEARRATRPIGPDLAAASDDDLLRLTVRLARQGHGPTEEPRPVSPRLDAGAPGDGGKPAGGPCGGPAPHEPAEGGTGPMDGDSPAEIAARRNAARESGRTPHPRDLITERVLAALARDPGWPDAEATVGAIRHVVATTLEIVRQGLVDEIGQLRAAADTGSGDPALRPTLVPPTDSANE